jgi:hypothetical protein
MDNASTVRAAIEKLNQHVLAGIVHHTGLLHQIATNTATKGGGGGGSVASPQSSASPMGAVQNLVGGLGKVFPQLGQAMNLFKPLTSAIMNLASAALPGAVGAAGGAIAGAAGAGGGAAGAIGGTVGAVAGPAIAAIASNPAGWIIGLAAAAVVATGALVAMPTAIHGFVDSLVESNRELAQVSSSMAAVLAQSQIQDFRGA